MERGSNIAWTRTQGTTGSQPDRNLVSQGRSRIEPGSDLRIVIRGLAPES